MSGRSRTGRRDPAPRNARPGPASRAAKAAAEPPSPEDVSRRAARLDEAVRLCGPADLDALLRFVPVKARQSVVRSLGVQADPRYIPGGVGRLVVGAVHALGAGRRDDCLGQICSGLAVRAQQVLGADRFADPSPEDLALLLDTLLEEVPQGALRLFFAQQVAHGCAAVDLVEALGYDPRLVPEPALPDQEEGGDATGDLGPAADGQAATPDADTGGTSGTSVADADARLFTPLDDLVIRTIVRTFTGVTSAPSPEELRYLVDELLHLSTDRPTSYFHVGMLSALDPETLRPSVAGMNPERWRAFRFGRLVGFVRTGDADAVLAAMEEREDECAKILADPLMGPSLVEPLILAALGRRPDFAARLLGAAHPSLIGPGPIAGEAHHRALELLAEGRGEDAEVILLALWRWVTPAVAAGDPPAAAGHAAVEVAAALAACRRRAEDFAGAQSILEAVEADPRDRVGVALLARERGLVAGRFGRLGHVHAARSDDERLALAARLGQGRAHFLAAVDASPDDPVASYCLGILALLEGRFADAFVALERADGTAAAGEPELAPLLPVARFHRGLAGLQSLDPEAEGPAYGAIVGACDGGFRPTAAELRSAADALTALGSPRVGNLLEMAVTRADEPAVLLSVVCEQAVRPDARAVTAAEVLGHDRRLLPRQRFAALAAALTGAGLLGQSQRLEELADSIDELVMRACDADLDRAWEQLLAGNDHLAEALGRVDADLRRVDILERLGEYGPARNIATGLFHRARSGQLPGYDAADLLDLVADLDASDDELERLGRLLVTTEEPEGAPAVSPAPVRLVFVGGNESQHQWSSFIDGELARIYGERVHVDWFRGFSADWSRILDQALSRLRHGDALVLMPYVRTNLGRHLRTRAGEAGQPWIPCTGKGRESMLRSLQRAVAVVEQQRAQGRSLAS